MSNILLVNDNVQDYQTIIDACKDNTYPITYNQNDDTYNGNPRHSPVGSGGGATRSHNTATIGGSGGSGVVILAYDI
tara:strand:+ start:344 stop:574 length:231 start_codon:yes stop_codon:yes gene_type:complete